MAGEKDDELNVDELMGDLEESLGMEEEKPKGDLDAAVDTAVDEAAKDSESTPVDPPVDPALDAEKSVDPPKVDEHPAADEAPSSWKKEAKAMWAQVPEPLKAEIRRRENDILTGIKGYKEAAEVGNFFHRAVDPYLPLLQQHGLNPFKHAQDLFETHKILATGSSEQKTQIIRGLAKQFGVALEAGEDAGEPAYVHPEVASLRAEVERLQSNFNGITEQQRASATQRHLQEVNTFAADPKNFLFEDVRDDIVSLLHSKAVTTLREAYDTAVARNPAARQKFLDHLKQQDAQAATAAAAKRATEARRSTATNVRTTPKTHGSTAPAGSIEDTLRETADKLYSS